MKLLFLGTRGEIESRSVEHRMHSSLIVGYRGRSILVDWGDDWRGQKVPVVPRALLLTHAHPDHAGGLRTDCPWPVYATEKTWAALRRYPIRERRVVRLRRPLEIAGMTVEAFPLEHSLRAPAVGYRIAAGMSTIFYAPDVVTIRARARALAGIDLYVGDGAAVTRSIVRTRGQARIGHASVRAQLAWCAAEGVRSAIFTHCGSEIVKGDPARVDGRLADLGATAGIDARIAYDGLELSVGRAAARRGGA